MRISSKLLFFRVPTAMLVVVFMIGFSPVRSAVATPCTGGSAAGFTCDNIDFLSHVDLPAISANPSSAADIWGFLDLNTNREYAIIGVNNGTAAFDITNPENPFEVGFIPGQSTSWRDIKIVQSFDGVSGRWNAYAYVTTDGGGITDGLFVIDLTKLPHSIERVSYNSDFSRAHNVFATNADYSTGLSLTGDTQQLIIAGSDLSASAGNDGQFRLYSLADPRSPVFVATAPAAGGMHDTTTFFVTDQRKDTQCVNAANANACEILIDFSGPRLDIWDITDASMPTLLSQASYPNKRFAHAGWQSEDTLYLYVQDELDERDFGLNTTLNVLSLADLTNPTHVGSWVGPTTAIDHNGFVRGNRYFMSHYTRGITILDISDPATPMDAGRFDTYATDDALGFNGAWGIYPFFHSGTIAVSDIDSGLYLLQGQTRNVIEGRIAFSASSYAGNEQQQVRMDLQRLGGSTGAVSVDFQVVPATADSGDYQALTGTVNWADGDSTDKSIVFDLSDDGMAENMERLFVRLISPSGGATLDDLNTASLFISDPAAQAELGFLDTVVNSSETGLTTVILVVQRLGNAVGQASADYAISGGDASVGMDFNGDTAGTLTWQDGDARSKSVIITIIDDADGEETEFFTLALSNPQGAVVGTAGTVRVNISSNEGPAPPPPPAPPPRSGGGGVPAPTALLMLGLFLARRSRSAIF